MNGVVVMQKMLYPLVSRYPRTNQLSARASFVNLCVSRRSQKVESDVKVIHRQPRGALEVVRFNPSSFTVTASSHVIRSRFLIVASEGTAFSHLVVEARAFECSSRRGITNTEPPRRTSLPVEQTGEHGGREKKG